jgi:Na+/melibiose symporter-like transporter
LLVTFVLIEKRSPHPLLRLGILRAGPLARANLGGALFFGAYIGFQFVVMLYLQRVLGWSALQTALGFLPAALIVAFGSPRIEPLIDRVGTPRTIFAGVVAHVLGYALFLRVDEHSGYAGFVLPSMILLGIGFTLAFSSLNIQATAGIADSEQGLAGGLLNTSLQVGGAIGLAVVTAVLTANGGGEASPAALLTGLTPALSVVTGIAVLGLLIAISGLMARKQPEPVAEPVSEPEDLLALAD